MTSSRFLLNILIASLLICSLSKAQQLGSPRAPRQTALSAAGKRPARPQAIEQKTTVSALPITAQTQISAALGRDQRAYQSVAQPGGFRLGNSRQGVSAEFAKDGVDFHSGNNAWGMALQGYGYGDMIRASATATPHADANRIEYRRGELTEWYLNGPLGLEQGFTLARSPGKSNGKPLTLAFDLSGDLAASVDADARGVTLKKNGVAALGYGNLTVTDARGRELQAWIEVAESHLWIRVDDAKALYPLTIDPLIQVAKLTASDAALAGAFAVSVGVSADGSTIVVGAPESEVDNNFDQGAAYVFVKSASGGWVTGTETAKLTASDGAPEEAFGTSVAVSDDGSTVVVGEVFRTTDTSAFQGAVYVFESADGWATEKETAKLTALNSVEVSLSGPVAISGDGSAIVASAFDSVSRLGAADVFVKPTSGGWITGTENAQLTASDGTNDSFGNAVAMSGNGTVVVVGSNFSDAAYAFVKPASDSWVTGHETAKLTATDGNSLGDSVAVSCDGRTIVAGATATKVGSNFGQGAAYLFVEPTSGWTTGTETAKLTASDGEEDNNFGFAVAMSGDSSTIAVGTPFATINGFGVPAAYVFLKPANGWATGTETAKLSANPELFFGDAVAVSVTKDTSTIVVGDSSSAASPLNAAHVFTGSPTAPKASLSTTSLTFGSEAIGTTSASQQVTLNNTGTAPLQVTSVSAGGSFSTSTYCVTQSPIAAGGSCTENVAFAPGSITSFMGTLTFTDDSGGTTGTTQTISLSGTGIQATSTVTLSAGAAIAGIPVTVSYTINPQSGDTLTPSGSFVLSGGGQSCTKSAPSGSCSFTFSSSGTVTITGTYAGDTNFSGNSNTLSLSLSVTPAGITNVINEEQTLGCIDNSGIAGALNAKLAAAQADITAGQAQQAINTLKALLNQLQAQQGKHIAATCTDQSGNSIDLIGLVKTLLTSLGVNVNADPIMGNVLNASSAGISGLTVNILNSKNATVTTAATDVTGFYFFPATSSLASGASYTVKVTVPKAYKSSMPGSQTFTWRATGLSLSNFTLN